MPQQRSRFAGPPRDLGLLFASGSLAGLSDGELLDRFVARRDEAAVAALVARHGAMVLGVCRRILADPHDADDAFQATFLVLARRAGSVRPADQVARWLHGVALRTARKARSLRARRLGREVVGSGPLLDVAAPADGVDPDRAELLANLDRAIAALPGRYRAPVVLCLLEGRTHREAADLLGWPVGTVSGRLSRGRALLARRIRASEGARANPGPLALPLLADPSLPVSRVATTAQAMTLWGLSRPTLTTPAMAPTLLLTREVIRTMMMSKIRLWGALVLGAGVVVGVGIGVAPATSSAQAVATDPASFDPGLKPLQGLWTGTLALPQLPGSTPAVQVLVEGDHFAIRGVMWGRFVALNPNAVMEFRAALVPDEAEVIREPFLPTSRIDLTDAPEPDDVAPTVHRGVYQVVGDSLRLCLSLPNKRRPEWLAVEPKTNQILLTLRRSPDRTWGDLRDPEAVPSVTLKSAIPAASMMRDPITGRPIGFKKPTAAEPAETKARPTAPAEASATPVGSPAAASPYSRAMQRSIQQAARAIAQAPEVTPDMIEGFQQLSALDPKTEYPPKTEEYLERAAWQALVERRRLRGQGRPEAQPEAAGKTLKQGIHEASQEKRPRSEGPGSIIPGIDGSDARKDLRVAIVTPPGESLEPGLAQRLGQVVPSKLIRQEMLTKDAMVLNYLPDWNFGTVDNLGIGNQHGGNWTLVDWKPVPPEEAKDPARRFFLAFYSRTTHSGPSDPGMIQASEILDEWPERVSWKTKPETSPETAANFRFEPGEGWKVLDITDLIRGRARQNRVGRGIALRFNLTYPHAEAPLSDYQMVSREATGEWESKRPRLLVVEPWESGKTP